MPDTITPKLGMVKPEIGGSADSWGNKLNGNFDKIDAKAVLNTDQWTLELGDNLEGSNAGPLIISRYNNSGIKQGEPLTIDRQTGEVYMESVRTGSATVTTHRFQYQTVSPTVPPAGYLNVFADVQGNPVVQHPNGVVQYLGVPPGTIGFTGADTADVGWALLNGQAIPRATNPMLFARYGTRFGAGDGVTTFNLPDAKGRILVHPDGGAGRLTEAVIGFPPTLASAGGNQGGPITRAQLPNEEVTVNIAAGQGAHTHTTLDQGFQGANSTAAGGNPPGGSPTETNKTSSSATLPAMTGKFQLGSGEIRSNIQPAIVMNAQIKLG